MIWRTIIIDTDICKGEMTEPTGLQKVCQCLCCSYKACGVAQCIDLWHGF